jgi:hypothetical protein
MKSGLRRRALHKDSSCGVDAASPKQPHGVFIPTAAAPQRHATSAQDEKKKEEVERLVALLVEKREQAVVFARVLEEDGCPPELRGVYVGLVRLTLRAEPRLRGELAALGVTDVPPVSEEYTRLREAKAKEIEQ